MKAIIIGGGIAGLTQGLLLREQGYDIRIYERTKVLESRGHAFLMSEDGLKVYERFLNNQLDGLKTKSINLFSLKRPNEEELIKIQLEGWHCLKRADFMRFLAGFFDSDTLVFDKEFSHFELTNGQFSSVVFKDGSSDTGDLFIGADGSHSAVRKFLFGDTKYTAIAVKEVVGISNYSKESSYQVFEKIQCADKGLAFGFIPATDEQSVWFIQYDASFENNRDLSSPSSLSAFCHEILKDFPAEVREVLDKNDFGNTYIWNTRDFDLLPTFHKHNAVLIGDAAHLALPFTSAGTTNAIRDAATLAKSLNQGMDLNMAFRDYYERRCPQLKGHIEQGRELKKIFLEPEKYSERGFMLPLISDKYAVKKEKAVKPLTISYFTDPICSTCWIFQPLLRKLELQYGEFIDVEYHMGGLLPSWEEYSKGMISNPSDAARLWDDMAQKHHMPLDGDIWIEDPLDSSYPPSIAFKAAQIQDSDKAISFLRRMKEMLFVEKKNINKWEHLEKAALTSGLDAALLRKDIAGQGHERFMEDLKHAQELGIHVFPTLIFKVDGFSRLSLRGYQPYDRIEEYIAKYVKGAKPAHIGLNVAQLFDKFNQLTESEIAFILDMDSSAVNEELALLAAQNIIEVHHIKNGSYWTRC